MSNPGLLSLAATHAAAQRILAQGARGATSASVVETTSLAAAVIHLVGLAGGIEAATDLLEAHGAVEPDTEQEQS